MYRLKRQPSSHNGSARLVQLAYDWYGAIIAYLPDHDRPEVRRRAAAVGLSCNYNPEHDFYQFPEQCPGPRGRMKLLRDICCDVYGIAEQTTYPVPALDAYQRRDLLARGWTDTLIKQHLRPVTQQLWWVSHDDSRGFRAQSAEYRMPNGRHVQGTPETIRTIYLASHVLEAEEQEPHVCSAILMRRLDTAGWP